jgi:hypothetical protein
MPGELTEITEITEVATALGTLCPSLLAGIQAKPPELVNVPGTVWDRLVAAARSGQHSESFRTAFANGAALLAAVDGLRSRRPRLVEWKGPHHPPGDDVVPADLRVDHVYLVSCKYLSKVMLNAGPSRLFDRLLVGEERMPANWFNVTAPREFRAFYRTASSFSRIDGLPAEASDLTGSQRGPLKSAFSARVLPAELRPFWSDLCQAVTTESARRWRSALTSPKARLRMLWRLLRITGASYFVLGTDRTAHLRLRVGSTWDWMQAFELRSFEIGTRSTGQPEVSWQAAVRCRRSGDDRELRGHVEIRWSHGRFSGSPEAKVYLDTPHTDVPGYYPLV